MTHRGQDDREKNADSVGRRDEGGVDVPRNATRASPETRREAEKGSKGSKGSRDKATGLLPDVGAGRQDGDPGGKDISRGG